MVTLTRAGSATLDAPAAASYARCLAAGAPDAVTSSYRDPVEQQALRDAYLAGNYPAYVAPVEKSDHCKGLAIDLRGPAAKAWFRAHGADHGWLFTDPTEDWHIAYRSTVDQHLADVTPPTPIEEDDDMYDDEARHERNWVTISEWYPMLLGRPGSHAEISGHANAVRAGTVSMGGLYDRLYNSTEAKNHRKKASA